MSLARVTDLPASQDAAKVAADNAIVKAIVGNLLRAAGTTGLTDRELTVKYFAGTNPGVMPDTPRKRRSELTRAGVALTNGDRRKSSRDRVAATIWWHADHYPIDRVGREAATAEFKKRNSK